MITHPLVHPKVAILAGLVAGALTLLAFAVWPLLEGSAADSAGLQSDATSSAEVPDHPRPGTLATGKVAAQNAPQAHLAQVLDAVRASLKRNDLASARVLLGALNTEQAVYRDDPRVVALQREWQMREAESGEAQSGDVPASASMALPAGRAASRYAKRVGPGHGVPSRGHDKTDSDPDYSVSGRASDSVGASGPAVTQAVPVQNTSALATSAMAPVPSLELQSGGLPDVLSPPLTASW
jgi:hypothetical protein